MMRRFVFLTSCTVPSAITRIALACCLMAAFSAVGCGTMKSHTASDQLLMSDAVDRAVAQIDFQPLAGKKVFLDSRYLQNTKDPAFAGNVKGLGFVNAEYAISAMRQQLLSCGCLIQDKAEDADYIVEARLGAVGIDNNELLFGIPASSGIGGGGALLPSAPMIPAIPEIAFAKRNISVGAAKIGAFAYHRQTRQPVWQSGVAKATSSAKDTWMLGAGPFQQGTIYEDTQLAGAELNSLPLPLIHNPEPQPERPPVNLSFQHEQIFQKPSEIEQARYIQNSPYPTTPPQNTAPPANGSTAPQAPPNTLLPAQVNENRWFEGGWR